MRSGSMGLFIFVPDIAVDCSAHLQVGVRPCLNVSDADLEVGATNPLSYPILIAVDAD